MKILRRLFSYESPKEPIGTYKPAFSDSATPGHLMCMGQKLNAIQCPEYLPLYQEIGTRHGGTGPEEFKLPDSRVILGGHSNLNVMVRYKHDIE